MTKTERYHRLQLERIAGGGQTIGTCDDGRKAFVWGGLPGEDVTIRETKRKKSFVEGIVTDVHKASAERIEPQEPDSYLSTSPWQIMTLDAEQLHKADLIHQAFALHNIELGDIDVYSDGREFGYRNKIEFSWWGDTTDGGSETLDLAFFRRGSKGKLPVDGSVLAAEPINQLARQIRDSLRQAGVSARQLKTLLIRSNQNGDCAWQLYVKDESFDAIDESLAASFSAQGGEVIYSDPRSPASRITKRLQQFGDATLQDDILGITFRYPAESFFQVNIPVYEQALIDMRRFLPTQPSEAEQRSCVEGSAFPAEREQEDSSLRSRVPETDERGEASEPDSVVDLYSGVGTIGLTIGGESPTLIEVDEHAVREMKRNIRELHSKAQAILAPAEQALEHITTNNCVIVDPPRAGLHADVVAKLLEATPQRIIYLSCNPVTQARDVELLLAKYTVSHHKGYNFFPRTPHIEHLVVLDLR